jgi:hypothetical protein
LCSLSLTIVLGLVSVLARAAFSAYVENSALFFQHVHGIGRVHGCVNIHHPKMDLSFSRLASGSGSE